MHRLRSLRTSTRLRIEWDTYDAGDLCDVSPAVDLKAGGIDGKACWVEIPEYNRDKGQLQIAETICKSDECVSAIKYSSDATDSSKRPFFYSMQPVCHNPQTGNSTPGHIFVAEPDPGTWSYTMSTQAETSVIIPSSGPCFTCRSLWTHHLHQVHPIELFIEASNVSIRAALRVIVTSSRAGICIC